MSSKGKKVKYSMDPRMKALLAKNKAHGHTEVLGMCLPLVVFIVLEVISLALTWKAASEDYPSRKMAMNAMAVRLVMAVLWGFLIYELCKRGHTGWAWVVVFLPLILTLLFVVLAGGILLGSRM